MGPVSALMLVVAGLIHLLPLPGVMGAGIVAKLYGVTLADPNLEVLLRHRAVLFGLVGAMLVAAAIRPELRALAYAAGLVSAVSFLLIALLVGHYNTQISRVLMADVVAVVCLLVGAAAEWRLRQGT